ncbi:flagellar hook-associated 2 domain-containing protein [Sulfuricella denitrificans skB26]|uniref:Flagellar hook-associated protein 2 n=1 Tax=Sulfuricella denitrificans (strain DSM 22764 / NBRC 105220 / skB26) TaxID=1163617 RepID=S6ALB1_SULDS|nr:flagellar filament capping protein FliD [Sulfuricella denitrificans]BAN35469.1 flagellar hook-associated 2 domain-containing protein [Sulfuricella denitrificans skB26]
MAVSASSLDVAGIVSQLMQVEQKPLVALNTKEANYQAKISAFGSIKSAVAKFQTAVQSLNDPAKFNSNTANSTDPTVMDASASDSAAIGSHSIEVLKLAQAQKLVAPGQSNAVSEIGVGTISFDFGTITDAATPTFDAVTGKYAGPGVTFASSNAIKTITIDSAHNTLEGIRDAINGGNVGITASIVNDGGDSPYRLVLSSISSGKTQSLKISVSGDAALSNLLANDPTGTQNMSEVATAQNAELKVDGVFVSKTTNTVDDVLQGVSLKLQKAGTSTLSVARDTVTMKSSVQGFVTAFNDMNNTLNSLSAYDPATKTAGILQSDSSVRTIMGQMRSMMVTPISGLTGTNTTLYSIGIKTQKDGSLSLDANKLQNAIDTNFKDIAGIFTALGSPSDSQIKFVSSSANTQTGTYAINASNLGTASSSAAGTIGGATAEGGVQTLSGAIGTSASGLQIQILGGATGDRGTVTFTRGYADQLNGLLSKFLANDGVIASRTAGLNQSVKNIGSSRDALNIRLARLQANYTKQFSALNTMMSQMQSTSDALTQQLANLPGIKASL